jgi:structural maintenance of chromosome 1
MHAGERYDGVVGKLQECEDELDEVRNNARDLGVRFDEVKKRRQKLYQECFQHISESLSVIYRDLTRSTKHPAGGTAYLTLDNTDEPYLAGTRFTAMPPMKRFRDMEQLSGGEKTMAALALLFSIHNFRQAPFFVLDEVDAALDNVNVKKICNYIQQRSRDFQCIVISLKDMFFEHADSLVGVAKDVDEQSSKIFTLSLKAFDDLNIGGEMEATKTYASPQGKSKSGGVRQTPQSDDSAITRSGGTQKRKVSPVSASKRGRRATTNAIAEDFED